MPRKYVTKEQRKAFLDSILSEGKERKYGEGYVPEEEPNEFSIETVMCEMCKEIIGKIDIANFKPPLHGRMFFSKDTKHGYPPPFHPSLPWEELRCPHCRKRPFYSRNSITNAFGEKVGFTFECKKCGEGFPNANSLNGHSKVHQTEV